MKGSLCIIFIILLLQFHLARSGDPLATALFAFGDSLSDSGNNNFLKTAAKVNFPPYGMDYPSGATGRFSNGKTFVDITAELLGLPHPPAYLSLSEEQRKCIKTGMNYASGGSGLLDDTGSQLGEHISFKQQVDYFENTAKVDMAGQFQSQSALSDHLAKSIFFISIGSNDLITNYRMTHKTLEPGPELEAFIQCMLSSFSAGVKRLYGIGARKFVTFDIGAMGCAIAVTSMLEDPTKCSEEMNQVASTYNERMKPIKTQLESELTGALFVTGDTFSLNVAMHENPQNYGFQNGHEPCCKATLSVAGTCTPNMEPCEERSQYMYWDFFHPTEATNSYFANECFSKTTVCGPMNIQQLAMQ